MSSSTLVPEKSQNCKLGNREVSTFRDRRYIHAFALAFNRCHCTNSFSTFEYFQRTYQAMLNRTNALSGPFSLKINAWDLFGGNNPDPESQFLSSPVFGVWWRIKFFAKKRSEKKKCIAHFSDRWARLPLLDYKMSISMCNKNRLLIYEIGQPPKTLARKRSLTLPKDEEKGHENFRSNDGSSPGHNAYDPKSRIPSQPQNWKWLLALLSKMTGSSNVFWPQEVLSVPRNIVTLDSERGSGERGTRGSRFLTTMGQRGSSFWKKNLMIIVIWCLLTLVFKTWERERTRGGGHSTQKLSGNYLRLFFFGCKKSRPKPGDRAAHCFRIPKRVATAG